MSEMNGFGAVRGRSVLSIICIGAGFLLGAVVVVAGFVYWGQMLGPIGYLVALTVVSDYILAIIRLVNYGITDWYIIATALGTALVWIGAAIGSKGDN